MNTIEDVIIEILSRLPVKSLLRFKSVCKTWQTLIDDSYFAQKHLEQSQRGPANGRRNFIFLEDGKLHSLDYESWLLLQDHIELPKIVCKHDYLPKLFAWSSHSFLGSCNGLVCIKTANKGFDLLLVNPCTRTYTKLVTNRLVVEPPGVDYCVLGTTFGFGYDAKIKDYKLVSITCIDSVLDCTNQPGFSQVNVLTIGTNTWRRLSNVPYNVGLLAGELVTGALHWIDNYKKLLICFDVEEEEFKVVSLNQIYDDEVYVVEIAELGGYLSLICYLLGKRRGVEVWSMKEYGVEGSLTKMFSIDSRRLSSGYLLRHVRDIKPLCILKNNEGILLKTEENLVLYEPKGNRYQHFHKVSLSLSILVPYRESLINLEKKIVRPCSDLELLQ
ncbi:hypothetical protein Sjap_021500 [Stephania japonica]|uniref:F-box domain-containing protein n=1 Tax=Stephania japonica TaxID=461633 RepID=A0AAP0ESQ9_9MAGN